MALGTTRIRPRLWSFPRVDVRLLVGFGLVAIALAGGLTLADQLRVTEPVVVAARTIAAGQVVTRENLGVGEARLEGSLSSLAIGEAELGSIVGQTASQTIHAGTLVVRPGLGSGPVIGADDVAVTVAVAADAVFGELRRGDVVAVMATSEPGRPQSQTTTLLERSTVYDVALDADRVTLGGGASDQQGGRITNVTLLVPRADAERVTHALVNGTLTLLVVSPSAAGETVP